MNYQASNFGDKSVVFPVGESYNDMPYSARWQDFPVVHQWDVTTLSYQCIILRYLCALYNEVEPVDMITPAGFPGRDQ